MLKIPEYERDKDNPRVDQNVFQKIVWKKLQKILKQLKTYMVLVIYEHVLIMDEI